MNNKRQNDEMNEFNEKIFKSYFERCRMKKLNSLNDSQRLLMLKALHSKEPLKFLYCHLN